tara:strand:- start:46 stop:552 length:507 start_codon:yes stop_codon:yes gene_type:complete
MTIIHKRIVDEIIEEQKKNSKVIAINLFGSVAEGKERSDSDVDIEIIINEGKEWNWIKQKKYGVYIDFVKCSKNHLLHQIENYPYLCYGYLDEKVIYDPEGFMVEVKKKVKSYMNQHPKVVKFWENKLRIMKKNKAKGQDPKDAIKSFDEAEILFSTKNKLTRDWFRE